MTQRLPVAQRTLFMREESYMHLMPLADELAADLKA